MWFLLLGLVVPHAPVLLPEVREGSDRPHVSIPKGPFEHTIVVSPHGSQTGVYSAIAGDLSGFGVDGVEVKADVDPSASDLAREWGRDMLDDPVDHGISVPLAAGWLPQILVACAIQEVTGPHAPSSVEAAIEDGRSLAEAVARLAEDSSVLLVASAHTSAALTPKAPLTERPQGIELDRQIRRALEEDVGLLDEIEPELWAEGGACGAGPLTAFGRLFSGAKAEVDWYEHPFGVGYLSAHVA